MVPSDRAFLSRLFHLPVRKFPGMLPVSIRSADVRDRLPYGYVVSVKADGERAFLFLCERTVWLLDRRAGRRLLSTDSRVGDPGLTVLDVEVLAGPREVYVFDALVLGGRSVVGLGYLERLEATRHWVAGLRGAVPDQPMPGHELECPTGVPTTTFTIPGGSTVDGSGWSVRLKPVYWVHHADRVWGHRHCLPFPYDGLVFTRLLSRYSPFRSNPRAVIKWKEHHTVDVLVRPRAHGDQQSPEAVFVLGPVGTCLSDRGQPHVVCTTGPRGHPMVLGFLEAPGHRAGTVLEVLPAVGGWSVVGPRTDKAAPNTLETIARTIESIGDGLTADALVNALSISTPVAGRAREQKPQDERKHGGVHLLCLARVGGM